MLDLSLHILDIAENGLEAGADLIQIELAVDAAADRLTVRVSDDGRGIPPEDLPHAANAFFTSRTTRRVGLGLSLFKQAAEDAGGSFLLESEPGRGTAVTAVFGLGHLDRPPLGDLVQTLLTLVIGRPDVDFVYRQEIGDRSFVLDTREIKAALEGAPLVDPLVIGFLRQKLRQALNELGPV